MTMTKSRVSPPPTISPNRGLWALVIVLTAVLIGFGAALLTWWAGASVPTAILAGGGAFATAVVLQIAIWQFVMAEQNRSR
jgi:membrane protein YdbS with pleckstrin-like domain